MKIVVVIIAKLYKKVSYGKERTSKPSLLLIAIYQNISSNSFSLLPHLQLGHPC
jgi:hypothetical protein